MKLTKFTFTFRGGVITVSAFDRNQAKILAQAEAIKRGWDYETIDQIHSRTKKYRIYYKHYGSRSCEATEEIFDDSFDANQRCFELNEHSVAGIYVHFTYREEL